MWSALLFRGRGCNFPTHSMSGQLLSSPKSLKMLRVLSTREVNRTFSFGKHVILLFFGALGTHGMKRTFSLGRGMKFLFLRFSVDCRGFSCLIIASSHLYRSSGVDSDAASLGVMLVFSVI